MRAAPGGATGSPANSATAKATPSGAARRRAGALRPRLRSVRRCSGGDDLVDILHRLLRRRVRCRPHREGNRGKERRRLREKEPVDDDPWTRGGRAVTARSHRPRERRAGARGDAAPGAPAGHYLLAPPRGPMRSASWTPEDALAAGRRFLAQYGTLPKSPDLRARYGLPSGTMIRHLCGSLRQFQERLAPAGRRAAGRAAPGGALSPLRAALCPDAPLAPHLSAL
jgi:hypothetical protein